MESSPSSPSLSSSPGDASTTEDSWDEKDYINYMNHLQEEEKQSKKMKNAPSASIRSNATSSSSATSTTSTSTTSTSNASTTSASNANKRKRTTTETTTTETTTTTTNTTVLLELKFQELKHRLVDLTETFQEFQALNKQSSLQTFGNTKTPTLEFSAVLNDLTTAVERCDALLPTTATAFTASITNGTTSDNGDVTIPINLGIQLTNAIPVVEKNEESAHAATNASTKMKTMNDSSMTEIRPTNDSLTTKSMTTNHAPNNIDTTLDCTSTKSKTTNDSSSEIRTTNNCSLTKITTTNDSSLKKVSTAKKPKATLTTTTATTATATTLTNNEEHLERTLSNTKEVGSRVYCRWPINDSFYWGIITKVYYKRINASKSIRFNVQFDDGDMVEDIGECKRGREINIFSELEYFSRTKTMPPGRKSQPPVSRPRNHTIKRYSPAKLFQKRCNSCSRCQLEDCGKCETCRRRPKDTSSQEMEICLRKMCIRIPSTKKAQRAAGLEFGWHFIFCEGKGKQSVDSHDGLRLISPQGQTFKSVKEVLTNFGGCWEDWEGLQDTFYRQIGTLLIRVDDTHSLVGQRYCHDWTNVDGHTHSICGTVTKCERNNMDDSFYQFTVAFDNKLRKLTRLSLPWALGGCISYDQKFNNGTGKARLLHGIDSTIVPKYWSWITPEARAEKLVLDKDGNLLPRLTMTVRGFQLTFNAMTSSIPQAGYGVFVKCVAFTQNAGAFVLAPGEILDIGVYAPFRKEDRKHETVFLLKNYIHNLKCEEWSFDTTDSGFLFDITEDETGNLHELARSHIPAYVNECGPDSIASVKAEHDPDGNVHYLLGAADGSSSFSLAADGSEHEIFINYGPVYEHVRVRKGYSRLPPDELSKQQQKDEDAEYISEILEMEKEEVFESLTFIRTLFPNDTVYCSDQQVLRRTLTVTAMLQHRGEIFSNISLNRLADDILSTLLRLRMDVHLSDMRQSPCFCYEVVKDQLNGVMSESLQMILKGLKK